MVDLKATYQGCKRLEDGSLECKLKMNKKIQKVNIKSGADSYGGPKGITVYNETTGHRKHFKSVRDTMDYLDNYTESSTTLRDIQNSLMDEMSPYKETEKEGKVGPFSGHKKTKV